MNGYYKKNLNMILNYYYNILNYPYIYITKVYIFMYIILINTLFILCLADKNKLIASFINITNRVIKLQI